MNIGSVLSGFDRFSGFSGNRENSASTQVAMAAASENVNNPSKVSGSWDTKDGKGASGENGSKEGRFDKNECHTCANRKYQDGSNDPGVSFKSPTKMSPDQAATAVLGHEMEHVSRNQSDAKSKGREVLSQTVVLQSAMCPECGRSYISGGETTTVTGERKSSKQEQNPFQVGMELPDKQKGKNLDAVA